MNLGLSRFADLADATLSALYIDGRFALISSLFFGRRPTAIPRLVVAVIVNTVYRFARRSLSHIGVKVFKLQPTCADRDPSFSIARPLVIFGVEASLHHVHPRHMGRTSVQTMSSRGMSRPLDHETPATFDGPGSKIRAGNPGHCPALTQARPYSEPFGRTEVALKHSQARESLSGDILNGNHGNLLLGCCGEKPDDVSSVSGFAILAGV